MKKLSLKIKSCSGCPFSYIKQNVPHYYGVRDEKPSYYADETVCKKTGERIREEFKILKDCPLEEIETTETEAGITRSEVRVKILTAISKEKLPNLKYLSLQCTVCGKTMFYDHETWEFYCNH